MNEAVDVFMMLPYTQLIQINYDYSIVGGHLLYALL